MAMMFFVAIGVGVADSHYNKIEAEVDRLERFNITNSNAMAANAKVEREAVDAAEVARLAGLAWNGRQKCVRRQPSYAEGMDAWRAP